MRRSLSRWTLAASVAFAGMALVTTGCKSSPLLAWFKSKPSPDNEAVVVDRGSQVPPPADGFTPRAVGDSYAQNGAQYDNQQAYGGAQGYGNQGYGAPANGTGQASGYDAGGYNAGGYAAGGYDAGGYGAGGHDAGGYAAAPVGGYDDSARGTRVSDAGYGAPQSGYNATQYSGGYGSQDQNGGGYASPSGGYGQPSQGGASAQQYQGGYDQGGQGQGGYDQGGYNQGSYDQGSQGGYDQGGYGQGSYDQGGASQGGFDQGSYKQSSQGGGYDAAGQGGYGANLPADSQKSSAQPGQSGKSSQVANQLPAGLSTNPGDYRPGSVRRAALGQPQQQTADASYDAAGYGSQSPSQNGYGDQGGYRESRGGGSFGGGEVDSSAAGQDTYYRR